MSGRSAISIVLPALAPCTSPPTIGRRLRSRADARRCATLPDERIVYHHSQIHFAPTHWLEISVFDPTTLKEKQIYPPKPHQPVRKNFIERVARVYRERGEAWFREHNHHMDPERFDSALVGAVSVDAAGRLLSFTVRFGGSDNANDSLPFAALVRVSCELIDQLEQAQCRERADVSPGR